MDLLDQVFKGDRYCFVCKYSCLPVVLWPQSITISPEATTIEDGTQPSSSRVEWSAGGWLVYVKVNGNVPRDGGGRLMSKHTEITCCVDHFYEVAKTWVWVAQDQVRMDALWDNNAPAMRLR